MATGVTAAPKAKLAVVTPTHQCPTGVALSLPRRLALLAWAARSRRLGAGGRLRQRVPLHRPPVAGAEKPGSRTARAVRRQLQQGAVSGAAAWLPGGAGRAGRARSCGVQAADVGLPVLEQRVVAAFMRKGHFARHIRRMRVLYARPPPSFGRPRCRRRSANASRWSWRPAGMHLLARFPGAADDGALASRAAAAGLAPAALSSLAMAHDCGQGLLLEVHQRRTRRGRRMVARLAAVIG